MARITSSKLKTGSGSYDVEGIVTNSAARVTALSATAATAREIIDLVHSVDSAYRFYGILSNTAAIKHLVQAY